MAALTVQSLTTPGVTLTWTAVSVGGDTFVNNGKTVVLVKNTNTTPSNTVTVTAATSRKIEGLSITNPILTVAGHATIPPIGVTPPLDPSLFNTSAGAVSLAWGGAAVGDTLVAVVSL